VTATTLGRYKATSAVPRIEESDGLVVVMVTA
jgi:hypothetical protein